MQIFITPFSLSSVNQLPIFFSNLHHFFPFQTRFLTSIERNVILFSNSRKITSHDQTVEYFQVLLWLTMKNNKASIRNIWHFSTHNIIISKNSFVNGSIVKMKIQKRKHKNVLEWGQEEIYYDHVDVVLNKEAADSGQLILNYLIFFLSDLREFFPFTEGIYITLAVNECFSGVIVKFIAVLIFYFYTYDFMWRF